MEKDVSFIFIYIKCENKNLTTYREMDIISVKRNKD